MKNKTITREELVRLRTVNPEYKSKGYNKRFLNEPREDGLYECIMADGEIKEFIFMNDIMCGATWFEEEFMIPTWSGVMYDEEKPEYWKLIYRKSQKEWIEENPMK